MFKCVPCVAALALAMTASSASAQLRAASWNITNYAGGRTAALNSCFYDSFQGRSMSPDVLFVQEMISSSGQAALVAILNAAPGSPGDWAASPYHNGRDTDHSFYYRTSRAVFLGQTIVAPGNVNANPRDIIRHDFRLVGYEGEAATISVYNLHMKAGSAGSNQARRLIEAQLVRADAETLPAARAFMIVGDFNIQTSTQAAYQEMVGSKANNNGRVFDPINTPGNWNNNFAFRFVHTQDQTGGGGVDDRYDQMLLSAELSDGSGLEYLGLFGTPYSTSTWNDSNHTYRSWGNDGTSFNVALTTTGNTMVGQTIAQALIDSTGGGSGHLPTFLDLIVPPTITADSLVDLGDVEQGTLANASISVANGGDVALWNAAGIADLEYSFDPDPGVSAPVGTFFAIANDAPTVYPSIPITVPISNGSFALDLRINHNGLGIGQSSGVHTITIIGNAISGCIPDVTTTNANPGDPGYGVPDGAVNGGDLSYFVEQWLLGNAAIADVTTTNSNPGDPNYGVPDGAVNGGDLSFFVEAWLAGCP